MVLWAGIAGRRLDARTWNLATLESRAREWNPQRATRVSSLIRYCGTSSYCKGFAEVLRSEKALTSAVLINKEGAMSIVACRKCGTRNRVDEQAAKRLRPKCGQCGTLLDRDGTGSAAVGSSSPIDTSKPLTVTDATFPRDVLGIRDQPVLLDCWAPWCGPCRLIAPVLEQLAAESNGKYLIAKLNVDDNPRVAGQFQIQSIPTMLIFKNGTLVDRLIGAQPKQAIAAKLAAAAA
jgi:thioredoxin 2